MVPTDWSMMSISDNNLCTLLDLTRTTLATKTLLSQLPVILHSNLLQASSLDQVLVSCNAGLPVDAFEEYSRSKKPTLINDAYLSKDSEDGVNDAQSATTSSSRGNVHQVTSPSPSPLPSSLPSPSAPSASRGGQGSGQTSQEVLKVLSKSPHIIMCCPNKGTVSYILTVPTTDASSPSQTLPRILPSPSMERQGPLVFDPQGGVLGGRGIVEGVKVTKNHTISMKGKEKAVNGPGESKNMLDCIQHAINGIINPPPSVRGGSIRGQSSQDATASSSSGDSYSNVATPSVTSVTDGASSSASATSHDHAAVSHDHSLVSCDRTTFSSRDYDPEKFSKFADFLVKMDPIESLSSFTDDEPATSSASRTNSTESEPMDSMECGSCDPNVTTPSVSSLRGSVVEPHPSPRLARPGGRGREQDTAAHSSDEDSMSWLFSEPGSSSDSPSRGGRGMASSDHVNSKPSASSSHHGVCSTAGSVHEMENSGTSTTLVDEASGGMDFNLELDTESWKEFLRSPPCRNHQQGAMMHSDLTEGDFLQINELVENFSSSGLEGVQRYNKPSHSEANTSHSPNVAVSGVGQTQSVPRVAVSTADSDSWNGIWQNCNPDSIKNWLQSTIPLGKKELDYQSMYTKSV